MTTDLHTDALDLGHGVPHRRRWAYGALLTVVAGVMTAAVLNAEPLLSANDRSRWCTVWSLVERGTWQIDEIDARPEWNTIDKVRHEGHFYSSKPPLLSAIYAGVYWVITRVTDWTLLENTVAVARTILVVTHLIPWLIAMVILCRLAERYIHTDFARLLFVTTAGFGTFVTTFTTTINNHSVAAVTLIFAIYSALRVMESKSAPDAKKAQTAPDAPPRPSRLWLHAPASGFFAALTCAFELPAALFGALLFLLLLRVSWKATLFAFVPAALIPLGAFFYSNVAATGELKPFYSYYGTDKYEYTHEGVPSYWTDKKGLDRAVDSPAVYFMHCTIGHHGILSLTPIWIVSLAGWFLRRRDSSPLRAFVTLGLILNLAVLAFYMSRPQNYNFGGNCCGLRWMVWVIPFWLIALVPAAERWGGLRWFRAACVPLLAVSIFSAFYGIANPWKQPWLFSVMQRVGWLKQYDPAPPEPFPHPLTTWFASIPPSASEGEQQPWIEFRGLNPDGEPLMWRLTVDPVTTSRPPLRTVRLIQKTADEPPKETKFLIDLPAFEAGKPPHQFLKWDDGPPDDETQAADFALLRGLAVPRAYREGVTRYLKTPARRDAFKCQRAAAQMPYVPPTGRRVMLRSDLWLCHDLPFGVAQIETTVRDAASGETLSVRRLTVSDYFPREATSAPAP